MNSYDKEKIQALLDGEWLVAPPENWQCDNFAINEAGCFGDNTLFIAIDRERWLKGSGNSGVYGNWEDTHKNLSRFQNKICGVIVEHYIDDLDSKIPQFKVANSYEVIKMIGYDARSEYNGKIIALTGTVGKTTTKNMLHHLLSEYGSVESTYKNHNTRTGVPLTLARCVKQPDYCVLEVAISALWMRSGSICLKVKPDVAIITEVALGQTAGSVNTSEATAIMKARITQGIHPDGTVILNRDMIDFELIESEVQKYCNKIVTYGFHTESDVKIEKFTPLPSGSMITIILEGTKLEYFIPLHGSGMVRNSVASLSAIHVLGLDPLDSIQKFSTFQLNDTVLEIFSLPYKEGVVDIIDDSYNAEIPSMISAFEVFKEKGRHTRGKRIAILGRIVNLGDNAPSVHQSLAEPLLETGVDLVFAYGAEMKYLMDELPQSMIGGFFSSVEACAIAISKIVEVDDLILIKGSRRANDFGRMRDVLCTTLENSPTNALGSTLVNRYMKYSDYCVQTILPNGSFPVFVDGNPYSIVDRGIGNALLLLMVFESIAKGQLRLETELTIGQQASRDSKAQGAVGFEMDEKIVLLDLINAIVTVNAPDAILALAECIYGNTNEALKLLKTFGRSIGIDANACLNITGRRMPRHDQSYSINDLALIVKRFMLLPLHILNLLSTVKFVYKGKLFQSSSSLVLNGVVFGGYFFGKNSGEGFVFAKSDYDVKAHLICNSNNNMDRDLLLSRAIDDLSLDIDISENITQNSFRKINILGDTYFGEYYSDLRKRKGMVDALNTKGYSHSFEKLVPFLEAGDLNIVNLEASLTHSAQSVLKSVKPFVLSGHPENSSKELSSRKIGIVTLANNHAMDYGSHGLTSTLSTIRQSGIETVGAGLNENDAYKPFIFKHQSRPVYIYNGYWYRKSAHLQYDFYALGNKPGVACLDQELVRRIENSKRSHPDSKVIVIAHWGADFKGVHQLQSNAAMKLIDSGADLIIGHGAHMMQRIEKYKNKWVVYSIGNGVFNSNGEYTRRKVPPFGFMVQLDLDHSQIKLYPIFTDNLKNFWQPHPITEEQVSEVVDYHRKVESDIDLTINQDEIGYYFLVDV